jgi:hypothetical protein
VALRKMKPALLRGAIRGAKNCGKPGTGKTRTKWQARSTPVSFDDSGDSSGTSRPAKKTRVCIGKLGVRQERKSYV